LCDSAFFKSVGSLCATPSEICFAIPSSILLNFT
jgi:hypothetical protein